MADLQALSIAYAQQHYAVRLCENREPPYEDVVAHRRWEESLADLREDLAKSHVELDVALFGAKIPTAA